MLMRDRVLAALALLSSLLAGTAQAQVEIIELAFGASNIQATTGNGGLTVGVSRDGDITVLSWPSPSYYDQIHYLSGNGKGARELPRMGALPGMGAFAGLVYSIDGGTTRTTSFLRDDP